MLSQGQSVEVKILKVNRQTRKIALGMKQLVPDPWTQAAERYTAGARVQGKVARLADFGAFVTLAPGIDGLVHVSEAAPQRVAHVNEVLEPGQLVEAVVLGVDPVKKRISLSIREAQADALPAARVPVVGEIVEGRVGGIKPFGVFVDLPELGPRTSGLLPREQTGEPRGADLSRVFSVGQALRVEILDVKEDRIRLGLVHERPEPRPSPGRPAERAPDRHGPPAAAPAEPPLTTMAIALREAMERARKKKDPGGPA
jgi:small subunit ribosomal protein S1